LLSENLALYSPFKYRMRDHIDKRNMYTYTKERNRERERRRERDRERERKTDRERERERKREREREKVGGQSRRMLPSLLALEGEGRGGEQIFADVP
jgi:hypothetical protein